MKKYEPTKIDLAYQTAFEQCYEFLEIETPDLKTKLNDMNSNYLKNITAIEIKLKEAEELLKQLKLSLGKIDDIT